MIAKVITRSTSAQKFVRLPPSVGGPDVPRYTGTARVARGPNLGHLKCFIAKVWYMLKIYGEIGLDLRPMFCEGLLSVGVFEVAGVTTKVSVPCR